jgi:hypothetical protein
VLPPSISRVVLLSSLALALSACADEGDEALSSEFRSLDDGLELHWTFEDRADGKILDLSGNGRTGSLNGGSFVPSPMGEAATLDGFDDTISFALNGLGIRDPALYGGVTGDFTLSARVRVNNSSKINTLCYGCGPMSSMYVGSVTYPGKLLAAIFNQQSGGVLWPLSTTVIPNDQWREVTLVVDGGVSARFYLDCVVDGQLLNANLGLKDYGSSVIGQGPTADRWFAGQIDNLRIWSRALSESEMPEVCQQAPPPPDLSPKMHWTFEDRSGNQITDVSGNGYHGTLTGGGSFVSSTKGEAVSLDGVNDYVSFVGPRAPALYGGVSGDFTISARVRVPDLAKFNTLSFGAGPSATWYIGDTSFPGRMTASFLNQSNNGTMWTASTPTLTEDQWTEITMVVDGGTSVRHYFNCALDSQLLSANIGLKDFGSSSVGYSGNAARWFAGEIDELRVWDRALPDDELADLCDCLGPILVDIDAPDGGNGRSWATAYNDLQDAIDAGLACNTREIWVAEGTYAPNSNAPVATITKPVSIYGGFAGTETSLAQRDFVAHPVRLGADGWQSRVVLIKDGAVKDDTIVRLDGFTISGSQAGAIEVTGGSAFWPTDPVIFFHNLVLTDNNADRGGGIEVNGLSTFEVANSHFEGNVATERGAALYYPHAIAYVDNSAFIANENSLGAIYDSIDVGMDLSALHITNSTLSGNIGGAIRGERVYATNCEFSNNTSGSQGGAAIYMLKYGSMEVNDCTFTNNQTSGGASGGAIATLADGGGHFEIIDSTFSDNKAQSGGGAINFGLASWGPGDGLLITGNEFNNNVTSSGFGGAILIGDGNGATLDGNSFVGNTALGGGGGALYVFSGDATIENSSFIDNRARYGGAIQIDDTTNMYTIDEVVIRNSRFVSNDATVSTGGAIRNLAPANVSVTNTEFVGNTSVSHGGGFYGRATFTSTTFANNVAGGSGHGLFASAGASMTIRNVTAWPDNLSAASMILDHSCTPQVNGTNNGSVWIVASPFAPADLDLDGLTEYYLAPGSACVNIGGTVGEFDWTTLTTQASQCTDSNPVDAGVHYTPQSAVGPC